jgi:DnaJ-class molecular chaperone
VETAVGAAIGAVIGGPAGSVAGGLVGRQVATHTPRLAENKHKQPDSVLRSAGKGLPNFCARGPGSLFVRLRVRVPEKLSTEERKLFERLREIRTRDG